MGEERRDRPDLCCPNHHIVINTKDLGVHHPAQARRVLDNGVEDWLTICGLGRDDAEDLARRRLLLERLIGLLEQAHVFDRR